MKKRLVILIALSLILAAANLSLVSAAGTKSSIGVTTDWGTTKSLDDLYALKKGWTIAYLNLSGKCVFEKVSWDEIDSEGALFKFLLNEADLNKDNIVTRVEASRLLEMQKATMCRNANRR